jgi:glycosyltransferase involved in cell wall biosynthesis
VRIGVLTTSYPRAPGDAAGSFVAGFTRWLAAQGHDLEVVAAGPGDSRDGAIPVARVRAGAGLFYDEGAPERLGRSLAARARAPIFSAALLAHAVRRARRWDRVVSHWLLPSGVVGALLGRPHLAIAHSGDVHLAARPGVADAVGALLARSRTRIAFVAEHLRRKLLGAMRSERSLAERSLICPMGVDGAGLANARAGDRRAARRRLGLPASGPLVAFLGRLVPIKGTALLWDALPAGAVLAVAGDGPLRPELAARGGAHLLGELRGAARDDLFCAADVLAVPSLVLPDGRTEGAPLVVAEALAAGVPLVAADLPGVRELAAGAAWLHAPGDAASLRAALVAALAGDARREGLARERSAALAWDAVGPKLLQALATC